VGSRLSRRLVAVGALAALGALVGVHPAGAVGGVIQAGMVTAVPVATPNINDGETLAIMQVGTRVIVGGTFTNVSPSGVVDGSHAVRRNKVLALAASSGALDNGFTPTFDGTVWDLWPGPSPDTVYVAGAFSHVNSVATKGIALLSTVTGLAVPGFKPDKLDGIVYGVRLSGGHLFIGGSFHSVDRKPHAGLATLDPVTGALDPYMGVQLTGHHNDSGTGSQGGVGARKMSVSPDGSRLIVIGNFKNADGTLHDQIVSLLLGGPSVVINPAWNTLAYTAYCSSASFDTYVTDVDFAPDGSYFVVAATGGSGTNIDGTKSSCDTAARWNVTDTGTNVRPRWIDYSGKDTLASVAVTSTAVYVGGHQRWLNNPRGSDFAGPGAVPRPGLGALDPASGVPLSWNPGRNPRGVGAAALLATSTGLWVGSDTDRIGNYKYFRGRIAYFPLAGGVGAPGVATGQLPGDVYLAGTTSGGDTLRARPFDGTTAGSTTTLASGGTAWGSVRGAFVVAGTLFYGMSDGNLYRRSFDGATLGAASLVDPYEDPLWASVQTGSGQTYLGQKPGLYGAEMQGVSSMFYSAGKLYYTVNGKKTLFSRSFSPQSGIVTEDRKSYSGVNLSNIAGAFLSGNQLYFASRADGTLHRVTFNAGVTVASSNTVVSGPGKDGNDWRARGLFLVAG
jgi:hypothetical protein